MKLIFFNSNSFFFSLLYESHLTNSNLSHEWSDYISPAKRPHHSLMLSSSALPHLINHPSLFEYQNGIHSHQEQMVSIDIFANEKKNILIKLLLLASASASASGDVLRWFCERKFTLNFVPFAQLARVFSIVFSFLSFSFHSTQIYCLPCPSRCKIDKTNF